MMKNKKKLGLNRNRNGRKKRILPNQNRDYVKDVESTQETGALLIRENQGLGIFDRRSRRREKSGEK